MGKLDGLKPEKVFYYFEEISKIPRGSGNSEKISEYCVNFAKERGLFCYSDRLGNVYIRKEASFDKKNVPGVILQGHLDMVTEKKSGSNHDFLEDGLELFVEDGFVKAKDTTLGADDGIAIAYALAILDSNIELPQIEALFTIDEETGMDGAREFDTTLLQGKYMLNLDSEEEGIFVCGCAGGAKVSVKIPYEMKKMEGIHVNVKLTGLKGGHSGVEIDKERANASIEMSRILKYLHSNLDIGLTDINGGNKDNAIPRECEANIVIKEGSEKIFEMEMQKYFDMLKNEFAVSDENINLSFAYLDKGNYDVLLKKDAEKVLFYLNSVPNGVINMNPSIKGLVETSLNLGILKMEKGALEAVSAVRSSVGSRKKMLIEKIYCLANMIKADVSVRGEYPEWEYKEKSKLRDVLCDTYKDLFDKEPKIDVIHAGLECGYISKRRPDIDIVAFGPDIFDIHTTEERMVVKSVERCYNLILEVINRLEE